MTAVRWICDLSGPGFMMVSWPLVKYVLTASVRDRLVVSLFVAMAVGVSLSVFLGSAAVLEPGAFAVVFAAGGLRLAGALGLVLFIVFYLRRAFETRDVDFLLSRPLSRAAFLLSHSAAFMLMAFVAALFVTLAVCAITPNSVGAGHALWGFSLLMEYIIVANAALFFAMVLPNATSGALAVLGFYVLARLIWQILGIAGAGFGAGHLSLLTDVMHVISLVVPRLDLMAQTSWLVYGPGDAAVGLIVAQGVLYSALLASAALVDLERRQF